MTFKVPWWNKRTKMERKLVVIVGTFVVVGVTLSAVIMVNDHQDSEVKNILFSPTTEQM